MPRLLALLVCLALTTSLRAADLDPHLPADTESYIDINVKQILASPVIKTVGVERLKGWLNQLEGVEELTRELGFDPFVDLDRVVFAAPRTTEFDRGLIILTGKFDKAKFQKKADDAARDNDDSVKLHRVELDAKVTHPVYEFRLAEQKVTLFAAVASNKTLLASAKKDYVSDALKQAHAKKKKPALKNQELQSVVQKLDARQGVSLALRGASLGKGGLMDFIPAVIGDNLGRVQVLGGGIGFTDEIKLELVGSTRTENDARVIRDLGVRSVGFAQATLALLGADNRFVVLGRDLLNSVKFGGKGKVVSLSARVTEETLKDFFTDEG